MNKAKALLEIGNTKQPGCLVSVLSDTSSVHVGLFLALAVRIKLIHNYGLTKDRKMIKYFLSLNDAFCKLLAIFF